MGTRRDIIKPSTITYASLIVLVTTIILYLYFLNMSVVQVVMRTENVQRGRELDAEIAMLEASYMEAQHVVSSRIASLEGYNTSAKKVFVSREHSSFVLRDN